MIEAVRLLDRSLRPRLSEGGQISMTTSPNHDQGAVERTDTGELLELSLGVFDTHRA
jgi:hypothetical protein